MRHASRVSSARAGKVARPSSAPTRNAIRDPVIRDIPGLQKTDCLALFSRRISIVRMGPFVPQRRRVERFMCCLVIVGAPIL